MIYVVCRIALVNSQGRAAMLFMIQIGCTQWATYALADGILYVSGENSDGRAGLGHKGQVIVPTPIDFGNRQ